MKTYKVKVNGKEYEVVLESVEETKTSAPKEAPKAAPTPTPTPTGGKVISAPIAGKVLDIKVKVGDSIKKGDNIAVIEAMKLENEVPADTGGVVKNILVKKGDHVENGTGLIELQ